MKSIIILILILLFILYLYGELQLRFGNQVDNNIKILEILTFLLSICAIISRKWWMYALVFILIIVLIMSPRKIVNSFKKGLSKLYEKIVNFNIK